MNSRSPRVVSSPRMPRRGWPPGEASSQTVMPIRHSAMKPKNAAVGHVQAIHVSPIACPPSQRPSTAYTRPSAKPLAM